MAELSIHCIDVSRAVPAGGMRAVVSRVSDPVEVLADSKLSPSGTLDPPLDGLALGVYEVRFHVGDFCRTCSLNPPDPAFLDVVPFRFGIADAAAHYHLPLKFTPWGFSLFRGG